MYTVVPDAESFTHRRRMLATIRGEPTDQIPWAPRMDLWYIAQRARGTLPPRFQGLDLAGIAGVLGVACRAVQADYTRPIRPDDWALRGFGIENHPDFPFRVELTDFPLEVRVAGSSMETTITTPAGQLVTQLEIAPSMWRDGSWDPYVAQRPIRSVDDFEAVAVLFEHLRVVPQADGYERFRLGIGESGLAVASGMSVASPVHLMLHDLMELDAFIYLYVDDPAAVRQLAMRIAPFFEEVLEVVTSTEADVFMWGTNYDQSVTWPALFRDEIAPWLTHVSERAHERDCFVLTHADGENQALLPNYPSCGLDVAESVCVRPMVRNTLAELRSGFGPQTTVWGGIPAIALLRDSMSDSVFETLLDDTFAELGTGERLIFGVSDNVPPDADLARLTAISERIRAFGPVRPRRGAEAAHSRDIEDARIR